MTKKQADTVTMLKTAQGVPDGGVYPKTFEKGTVYGREELGESLIESFFEMGVIELGGTKEEGEADEPEAAVTHADTEGDDQLRELSGRPVAGEGTKHARKSK